MKNIRKIFAFLLVLACVVGVAAGLSSCELPGIIANGECVHEWGEWGIINSEGCPDASDPDANSGYRVRICKICNKNFTVGGKSC